jgi:hypothetical protein
MTPPTETSPRKSRLAALLEHFSRVEDPRDVRRILHPLPEILLLVVCGTIADCDDYEDIAAWGAAHLDFLRRHLPYEHGVPGERWLTILMNRIDPGLFAAAFADWVRESWPEKAGLVAIAGQSLAPQPRSKRGRGTAPPRLRLRHHRPPRAGPRQAVPDKAHERAAIPPLLETRTETRYFISSRALDPEQTAEAVRGRPRPLGDREPPPLGPRRRLRRRPIPPPQGPRRAQHGHRPTFRPQSRLAADGEDGARGSPPAAAHHDLPSTAEPVPDDPTVAAVNAPTPSSARTPAGRTAPRDRLG